MKEPVEAASLADPGPDVRDAAFLAASNLTGRSEDNNGADGRSTVLHRSASTLNQACGVLIVDGNAAVDRAVVIITKPGPASSALDNGGVAGFDVLHGGNIGGSSLSGGDDGREEGHSLHCEAHLDNPCQ